MTAAPGDLVAAARQWLADDPDPETRAELAALLDRGSAADLEDRFGTRLTFGTAGLRGALGAGPNRMNRVTVRRAAAGLARWLSAQPDRGRAGVAVGYDARHKSEAFALDTVAVVAGAGIPVFLLPGPLPTPLLAFAVRHVGCAAGVMVTASHNPAIDNGYKVYLADGAQLIPPADQEISDAIAAVGPLAGVALAEPDDPLVTRVGPDLVDAYLGGALRTVPLGAARDVRIVYTPVHGVGRTTLVALLERAGFPAPHVVAAQAEPDPDFPTAAFPNPEEPGVLDLALAEARRVGADVVLANDPDADRLAVAVPEGGDWRVLRGDELGCLLADHLLRRTEAAGADRLLVTTVVSSRLLAAIAAAAGVHHDETLTGFKWIVRPALAHPEWRLVLGYEEALGYMVGDLVRDKDGLTAALAFADLAAALRACGETVAGRLDALARRHGLHATDQRSVRYPGPGGVAAMAGVMAGLRADPPDRLGGRAVAAIHDLRDGGRLAPADVLVLELTGGRVVVRPSGTEPKLKAYAEVVVPVAGGDVAAARATAATELAAIWDALLPRLDTPPG